MTISLINYYGLKHKYNNLDKSTHKTIYEELPLKEEKMTSQLASDILKSIQEEIELNGRIGRDVPLQSPKHR
jgi:hypothetical protein